MQIFEDTFQLAPIILFRLFNPSCKECNGSLNVVSDARQEQKLSSYMVINASLFFWKWSGFSWRLDLEKDDC